MLIADRGIKMVKPIEKLAAEIRNLPDKEKLQLVDVILEELVKPDPDIDRIWAEDARKRWTAYQAGQVPIFSYDTVMAKHRRS